jgi:23S rRNA U2552 (ribose-2'-O)-methylase RlmE/FtsJ
LAEGPGGFIEAVCNKRANPADIYTGMTILYDETDDNVPAWNKTEYFLSKNQNVFIETGADGTGNIMRLENFDYCVSRYGSSMDLITADGGFDFSKDFNKQELIISNLLWGQTCYALCMQKYGGNFVLKIFDCFYEQTVDILYLLSAFYTEVNVCKLQTSRLGNSEKYVVCRGFRMKELTEFLLNVRESFRLICQNEKIRVSHLTKFSAVNNQHKFRIDDFRSKSQFSGFLSKDDFGSTAKPERLQCVHRFLDCTIPRYFVKRIEEMNAVFGTQQIENIHYTISIIDKNSKYDRLEQLTKQNMQKCVAWCIEHGIAYNNFSNTNMFVSDSKPETKQMEDVDSAQETTSTTF